MEIDIQKIKDDVAKKNGHDSWHSFHMSCTGVMNFEKFYKAEKDVIFEVHKQTAELQRKNCNDFIFGSMIYPEYKERVFNLILNAPSPKIN